MGILDKKTRFIDLVVTQEGKRQIAAGKLRAEYASFTDSNAFYKLSDKDDVNSRLYFEVMERPENSIVSEKDDSGRLININTSEASNVPRIVGNNIFTKDNSEAARLSLTAATGSDFQIGMQKVMDTSMEHFRKNYFIGTNDPEDNNEFELSKQNIEFTITNQQPFNGSPYKEIININDAEPFFLDAKLAHLPNFQFLPPVSHTTGRPISEFKDIRSTKRETWEDIKQNLAENESDAYKSIKSGNNLLKGNSKTGPAFKSDKLFKNGKLPHVVENFPKQIETILFPKTSTDNNILLQVYEDSIGPEMNKLDIIDAGVFYDDTDKLGRHEKQVYYVGKVYYDDFKMPTFINIFTIIMD